MPSSVSLPRFVARVIPAVCLALLAACDSDPVEPAPKETISTFTADASSAWAFVNIADLVQVVTDSTSAAWDIAFNRTAVRLNGNGAAVTGYCICQNEAALDDVLKMTPESELADFWAVTAAPRPGAK